VVKTTNGNLTVVNHNEHSGYYGGFSMAAKIVGENETEEEE
jgi:hypothetical protein